MITGKTMLDQNTKRNIDSCRDILVGKIPDPKSQVEQITIALIYKFMDDMDQEAVDIGGKASFFTGEYEKYSWTNIFNPRIGGHDLTHLYGEAIERMNQNPNIPQLFRDIFKNAYLPYRDPETLKLFLKEINNFEYSHSEKLGDAFEYLLSFMGTQGDAGQFRTPRHIIDFIVEAINPQKNETILDPACGTAGFLISAYKHIMKSNSDNGNGNGNQLTPTERKRLLNNFTGYDISPDMVRLSLVNLYLHGFQDPSIYEYDTLTSEERWNDTVDVILANPPFMTPKGGIRPHKRFGVQANRSEVLFVDYIAEHLNPSGRAGVIVPEGIIFQSSNAYKALRKMLVEDYLWAVVSLPAGVFNPYSGVKTSILLLDKFKVKRNDSILFIKVENDGFDLGAQRRSVQGSDLVEALQILKDGEVEKSLIAHYIEKSKITESGDWNLSGERYRVDLSLNHQTWEMVHLKDVAEYVNGYPFKPSDWKQVGKKIIRIQNLTKSGKEYNCTDRIDIPKKYLVQKNDLLISWSATIGFFLWNEESAYLNQHIFKVVENKSKILRKYFYYLGDKISDKIREQVHGNTMTHITKGRFEKLQIPLPPLSFQEEIVAEIDGYQKIIDGARMVVENYKPTVKIDPEWEMVEFKDSPIEIIDGDRGKNYPKANEFSEQGYCLFLNTKNVLKNGFKFAETMFITKEKDDILRKGKLQREDVVLTTRGTIGNVGYFNSDIPFENIRINSGMLIFRVTKSEIKGEYLFHLLQSDYVQKRFKDISSGSAQPQLPIRSLNTIVIPIPPISVQQKIVAQIEAEQEIMNANKKLIEIYEQKIKDKIAEVWGE